MEQGVAGSNPARFNFLINFFCVSNLKGGGYLIKSYKQLLFPFHRIASYCFFYVCQQLCRTDGQVGKSGVVMWRWDPVRILGEADLSSFHFPLPKYQNCPQLFQKKCQEIP